MSTGAFGQPLTTPQFELVVEHLLDTTTGRYTPTLTWEDHEVPLTAALAVEWACEVLDAVHAAAYDAAVLTQLHNHLGLPATDVAHLVSQLRADRPARRTVSAVAGMELIAGVSGRSGEPFLHVRVNEVMVGSWDLPAARQHALAMLEAVQVAALDTAYLRALRRTVGLELAPATAVINDLGQHRIDLTGRSR